jgi:hypothetical protein
VDIRIRPPLSHSCISGSSEWPALSIVEFSVTSWRWCGLRRALAVENGQLSSEPPRGLTPAPFDHIVGRLIPHARGLSRARASRGYSNPSLRTSLPDPRARPSSVTDDGCTPAPSVMDPVFIRMSWWQLQLCPRFSQGVHLECPGTGRCRLAPSCGRSARPWKTVMKK